jgi:hypothetical protein
MTGRSVTPIAGDQSQSEKHREPEIALVAYTRLATSRKPA